MDDTIVSIATSMTDAGIGILRISGSDAISLAGRVLVRSVAENEPNTIRFNRVKVSEEGLSDEVLVSVMKAPRSYTGEDVVEINTHGGRLIMERVLQLLLREGQGALRLAEPGEFTKRAFLNGKMDLTKAEAVQDLIGAQNTFAVENAARQLGGDLAGSIRVMREVILHEAAFLEAALDDPDVYEEQLAGYGDSLKETVSNLLRQMDQLLVSFDEGRLRKDGIRCAILGKPNCGKSTLLNLLAGEERAIVTNTPGTTRDVIEETIRINDLLLRVMDTAGIRNAKNEAEKIGIERAKKSAEEADLILLVIDATAKPDPALFAMTQGKKTVVLFNKCDLLPEDELDRAEEACRQILGKAYDNGADGECPIWIRTSFKNKTGTGALKDALQELFFHGKLCARETFYLTNIRHKEAIEEAKNSLACVIDAIEEGVSEDLYVPDLMDAYTALGKIIGEAVEEDLLDKIFSAFCLGK